MKTLLWKLGGTCICMITVLAIGCGKHETPAPEAATIPDEKPVSGIRIAWDYRTLQRVSEENRPAYNGYARLIELKDKRQIFFHFFCFDKFNRKQSNLSYLLFGHTAHV